MKKAIFITLGILFSLLIFGAYKIYLPISAMKSEDIHILPIDSVSSLDDIVRPYIEKEITMGLSVGIYNQGEISFQNYGICSKKNPVSPTQETVYEIGSITKTFTTAVLVQMHNEGKINLQDPISKYLPTDVVGWDTSAITITLEELATHHSGLPRIPDNGILKSLLNMENPYANYSMEDLHDYLRNYAPEPKEKRGASYSNLGVGILGIILARIDQVSYEELVSKRIFTPLQMDHSFTNREGKAMVTGHNGFGKPTSPWDIPTLSGAGAIKSNAQDMMKYLKANIEEQPPFEQTHKKKAHYRKNGDIGLAWMIYNRSGGKSKIIWHNGGTGGFRSFIGFNKEKQLGVIILSNCIQSVDKIGRRLLTLMERNRTTTNVE